MRLIDADAFKEYIKCGIDGLILPKDQAVKAIAITKSFLKDIDEQPTVERSHEKWEYLKEHITEMRDADGELNQKDTCKFILELMGVIEREGENK